MSWGQQPEKGWATSVGPRRMTAVRGFARYLTCIDPATEIPPLELMPHRRRWRPPFLYSPADIDTMMARTRSSIASPLRAATYHTVIGLLAASGTRIGEAVKLDRADVEWTQGVLLIRESKFGNYAEGLIMPSRPGGSRPQTGCGPATFGARGWRRQYIGTATRTRRSTCSTVR